MKRVLVIGILMSIVAALGVGLWLGGRSRAPSAYELERTAMSLKIASAMVPFRVAFRVLLGSVALFTMGGIGWGIVRWLNHRVSTLYPNGAGLYPVREERIGRAKVFHDPNRALTGTTVYAGAPTNLTVQHPLPRGQEAAQWQITAQAQATQALRAAVSGSMPLPPGQIAGDMFDQRRLSRPLPEVKRLDLQPSHIERLLDEQVCLEDRGR